MHSDLADLRNYENELQQKRSESDQYLRNVVIPTETRHSKNRYVLFGGTPSYYEETGLDTITVIDEDGYTHLMKETSNGSGVWKEKDEKTYIKCCM